jgi:hypothetical protein
MEALTGQRTLRIGRYVNLFDAPPRLDGLFPAWVTMRLLLVTLFGCGSVSTPPNDAASETETGSQDSAIDGAIEAAVDAANCPDASGPATLATGSAVPFTGLAANSTRVFWLQQHDVWSRGACDSAPVKEASVFPNDGESGIFNLAVDETTVYLV